VLDHLPRLVIKRLQRRVGERSVFGADLDRAQQNVWRERIRERPLEFVAQAVVTPQPAPSFTGRVLAQRPVLVRAFLTAGNEGYRVLPGGFARVAPRTDTRVISNQAGAMGKDVWVLASEPEAEVAYLPPAAAVSDVGGLSRRAAENLYWFGRYLERAQSSLQLLRMVLAATGDGAADIDAPPDRAGPLLQALAYQTGADVHAPGDVPLAQQLGGVLANAAQVDSVAFDLTALARAAEAVREHLPDDALHVLVDVSQPLAALPADALMEQIDGCVRALLARTWALSGAVGQGMERGDAWRFLDLGRCIERGQNAIGVLRSLFAIGAVSDDRAAGDAALAFAGGSPAYRHAGGVASLREAFERLLLDARLPRGLAAPMQAIERHVGSLPTAQANRHFSAAARLSLDASTRLRLFDLDRLTADGQLDRPALDQFLARGEHLLRALSDRVTADYFQPPVAPHALLALPPEP
jgi:uncharacterized alpha-E superfamily protein